RLLSTHVIYTPSLHDALPIFIVPPASGAFSALGLVASDIRRDWVRTLYLPLADAAPERLAEIYGELEDAGRRMLAQARVRRPASDRKSTRLNSSHVKISYAVF